MSGAWRSLWYSATVQLAPIMRSLILAVCLGTMPAGCRLLSALPCAEHTDCPPRSQCSAGSCAPSEASLDGGTIDGGVVDGGAPGDGGDPTDAGVALPWFDAALRYAFELPVTSGVARSDAPVVVDAPLQTLLGGLGTVDAESVRVVEHSGVAAGVELPSYFSHDDGDGLLVFSLPGSQAAGSTRTLRVYLGVLEDGDQAAPASWRSEARDPVEGEGLGISGLSEHALQITRLCCHPVLDTVRIGVQTRLTGAGVDHGDSDTLADQSYSLLRQARVVLDVPHLVVMEEVASAGAARLRQLVLLSAAPLALHALRVEELAPIDALSLYELVDPDLPEDIQDSYYDDEVFRDASLSAILVRQAAGADDEVVVVYDGTPSATAIGDSAAVRGAVWSRTLVDSSGASYVGDAAGAFRVDVPDLQGGALLRFAFGVVGGMGQLRELRGELGLDDPAPALGARVARP